MTGISLIGYLVYLGSGVAQAQPETYTPLARATILKAFHLAAQKAVAEVPDADDRARGVESVKYIGELAATAHTAVPAEVWEQLVIHGRLSDDQIADLVALFG